MFTDGMIYAGGCYLKIAHEAPMQRVDELTLVTGQGVAGDVNPHGISPRQVSIAIASSLVACGVSSDNARTNLVLFGDGADSVDSGCVLHFADIRLRITMRCEPCSHGAKLAATPTARFRGVSRFLGVVISGGTVTEGADGTVEPGCFASSPDDFRARTAWALDHVPAGRVVTTLEFLTAIGASASYARVLPRWLEAAAAAGKPVHRVLPTSLRDPGWAPHAEADLKCEGLFPSEYAAARYPLTRMLWFAEDGDVPASAEQAPARPAERALSQGALF